MRRGLRELYISFFAVCYKVPAAKWPAGIDSDFHKAVALVAFPQLLLMASVLQWWQILTHTKYTIPKPLLFACGLTIYWANLVVLRRIGLPFLPTFDSLSRSQRLARIAASTLIYAASIGAICLTAAVYQRTAF